MFHCVDRFRVSISLVLRTFAFQGDHVLGQEGTDGQSQPSLGIPLAKQQRQQAAEVLQARLYDLVDLRLKAKQLHWNVVGPRFRPLHKQLDEIAQTASEKSDLVAERILALGTSAS